MLTAPGDRLRRLRPDRICQRKENISNGTASHCQPSKPETLTIPSSTFATWSGRSALAPARSSPSRRRVEGAVHCARINPPRNSSACSYGSEGRGWLACLFLARAREEDLFLAPYHMNPL